MSAVRFVSILAQRGRYEAYWCAVALDALVPIPGTSWRAVCCICVDSLEVTGVPIDAHRVNMETSHDTGACSFCAFSGADTLVARVPDAAFAAPPARFLELRCAYGDRGGRLALLPRSYPGTT